MKQQTADLGGNVLLEYNAHEGGAFYCKDLPPETNGLVPTGIMIPIPKP